MRAIGNKIILSIEKPQERTKAGLFMPESTNTDFKIGTVVEVGDGEKDEPMKVNVGEKVAIRKTAGVDVEIDGTPYTVISQLDVLVVL